MANEIKAAYTTAKELDFSVYYDNAGTLTAREVDQTMTEQPVGSGLYKGTPATIEVGDIVIIEEGAVIVGSDEYQPEVNTVKVSGTVQTANDNSADINAILVDTTGLNGDAMRGTDGAITSLDPITTDKDSYKADLTTVAKTGADGDTLETLSDQIDSTCTVGSGDVKFIYTLYTDEDAETGPISDVTVWATTDEAGANTVVSGTTNDNGSVTFYLDTLTTYYFWRQKAGYTFTNPDTEIVV